MSPAVRTVTYDDVQDILIRKARNNRDQDKIVVTVSDVKSDLMIYKDIDVVNRTVRDAGMCHRGYFEKKFDSCTYNKTGDTRFRGLIMKPEEFLEEVNANGENV